MRRIVALFMFVVVALCAGLVATSSQVQAKGEPPLPGFTIKEIPPYIEGTLILLQNGTASFVGDCAKPFDTKFFNLQLNINLDLVVPSGSPILTDNMEGSTLTANVPAGCFKDGATTVTVIVKSVKNFTPEPAVGSPRSSIVARVVVARFTQQ
jgi:hypothetical protein